MNSSRRRKKMMETSGIIFLLFLLNSMLFSQETTEADFVGIDEKLGNIVSLDFHFLNSEGDSVYIADLIDKPTIFNFVYYNCPGICTPVLNGFQKAIRKLDMEPGKDYRIITVSFSKDEHYSLGARKKETYIKGLEKEFPENEWLWLVGDSLNINGLTGELGFKFMRTELDFAHPAALIVVSGEKKVTRYLYGISQNPFDVKMAIIEASEGKVVPSIAKVLKFCFSYDPEGRTYVFNFLKIAATIIIVMVIAFVVIVGFRKNNNISLES